MAKLIPEGFDFEFDYCWELEEARDFWKEAEKVNKIKLPAQYKKIMSAFGVASGGYERGRMFQIDERHACGVWLLMPMVEEGMEDDDKPLSALIKEYHELIRASKAPAGIPFAMANFYPDIGAKKIDPKAGDGDSELVDALLVFDGDAIRLLSLDGKWDLAAADNFSTMIKRMSDYYPSVDLETIIATLKAKGAPDAVIKKMEALRQNQKP